jgi:hypothetical protein
VLEKVACMVTVPIPPGSPFGNINPRPLIKASEPAWLVGTVVIQRFKLLSKWVLADVAVGEKVTVASGTT